MKVDAFFLRFIMEDEYNILKKFENLSSVNLAKELSKGAPKEELEATAIDESFDSFSDFENPIPRRKGRPKKTSGRGLGKSLSEGSFEPSIAQLSTKKDEPVESSSVAARSRSSVSSSVPDELNTSVSSCTRSKKAKQNSTRGSKDQNETVAAPTIPTVATKPKRGRKKAQNSSVEQTTITNVLGTTDAQTENNVTNQGSTRANGIPNGTSRNVMRARRNCIAERAARCATVDVIDLISSPMPRVEGFISLDSDEEGKVEKVVAAVKSSTKHESYFDDENPEISVKIMWNALPEVFPVRKHQKFECIFEQLAEREKTSKSQIFLNLDSKIIQPNDTPASIDYKIFQFIHGRAMVDPKFVCATSLMKKKRDPNLLVLKVQSDKWKKPLSIEMQKNEKFKKLVIKCSEELKMPYEEIKLSFDGEPLQFDQTPMDLEFEGGEVLEIHLKDKV